MILFEPPGNGIAAILKDFRSLNELGLAGPDRNFVYLP